MRGAEEPHVERQPGPFAVHADTSDSLCDVNRNTYMQTAFGVGGKRTNIYARKKEKLQRRVVDITCAC